MKVKFMLDKNQVAIIGPLIEAGITHMLVRIEQCVPHFNPNQRCTLSKDVLCIDGARHALLSDDFAPVLAQVKAWDLPPISYTTSQHALRWWETLSDLLDRSSFKSALRLLDSLPEGSKTARDFWQKAGDRPEIQELVRIAQMPNPIRWAQYSTEEVRKFQWEHMSVSREMDAFGFKFDPWRLC